MNDYDKADRECEAMQKQHGPGGELPTYQIGAGKPALKKNIGPPAQAERPTKRDSGDVKSLALRIIPYAVASSVVFYWQQSGQLAETTGFYTLIALALLGGLIIGRCFNG